MSNRAAMPGEKRSAAGTRRKKGLPPVSALELERQKITMQQERQRAARLTSQNNRPDMEESKARLRALRARVKQAAAKVETQNKGYHGPSLSTFEQVVHALPASQPKQPRLETPTMRLQHAGKLLVQLSRTASASALRALSPYKTGGGPDWNNNFTSVTDQPLEPKGRIVRPGPGQLLVLNAPSRAANSPRSAVSSQLGGSSFTKAHEGSTVTAAACQQRLGGPQMDIGGASRSSTDRPFPPSGPPSGPSSGPQGGAAVTGMNSKYMQKAMFEAEAAYGGGKHRSAHAVAGEAQTPRPPLDAKPDLARPNMLRRMNTQKLSEQPIALDPRDNSDFRSEDSFKGTRMRWTQDKTVPLRDAAPLQAAWAQNRQQSDNSIANVPWLRIRQNSIGLDGKLDAEWDDRGGPGRPSEFVGHGNGRFRQHALPGEENDEWWDPGNDTSLWDRFHGRCADDDSFSEHSRRPGARPATSSGEVSMPKGPPPRVNVPRRISPVFQPQLEPLTTNQLARKMVYTPIQCAGTINSDTSVHKSKRG